MNVDSLQYVVYRYQVKHSYYSSCCIIASYELVMLIFFSILLYSIFLKPGTVLNTL